MRYGKIIEAWADNPECGSAEISVLAILALYADTEGKCFPSQNTIAKCLNKSRPWVNAVIQKLLDIGVIQAEYRYHKNGGMRSCLYILVDYVCQNADTPRQPIDTNKISSNTSIISHADAIVDKSDCQNEKPEPVKQEPPAIGLDAWNPTYEDKAFVQANSVIDPDRLAVLFKTACQAKGYQYRDYSAGYRSWALNPAGVTGLNMRRKKPSASGVSRPASVVTTGVSAVVKTPASLQQAMTERALSVNARIAEQRKREMEQFRNMRK